MFTTIKKYNPWKSINKIRTLDLVVWSPSLIQQTTWQSARNTNLDNFILNKITIFLKLSVNTPLGIRNNISKVEGRSPGIFTNYDPQGLSHFLKSWIWLFSGQSIGFKKYLYKIWRICIVWLLRYAEFNFDIGPHCAQSSVQLGWASLNAWNYTELPCYFMSKAIKHCSQFTVKHTQMEHKHLRRAYV